MTRQDDGRSRKRVSGGAPASEKRRPGDAPVPQAESNRGLPLFPGETGRPAPSAPPVVARHQASTQLPEPRRRVRGELLSETQAAMPRRIVQSAGVLHRAAASVLDLSLLGVLDGLVLGLTLRIARVDIDTIGLIPLPPLVAFLALLNAAYIIALTVAGGQTFGKMVFGLRVVDATGQSVTFAQALARTCWGFLSVILGGIGIWWMLFDGKRRTAPDLLAGTRVFRVR